MAEKFLGICRYTPPPLRDGPARDLVAASPPVVGGPPRWILARLLPESPGDTGGSPLWRERVRGTQPPVVPPPGALQEVGGRRTSAQQHECGFAASPGASQRGKSRKTK